MDNSVEFIQETQQNLLRPEFDTIRAKMIFDFLEITQFVEEKRKIFPNFPHTSD